MVAFVFSKIEDDVFRSLGSSRIIESVCEGHASISLGCELRFLAE